MTTYSYAVKPFYTVGEVYDFILADLDEAERLLAAEESEMDYPRTNDNVRNFLNYRNTHFNLYAVWATKARVYWMRGDMANAATYAERVIASEKFPLATPQEMGDYLAGKLSEKETIFGVYSSSYIESVRTLIYNQTSFVSYRPYSSSGSTQLPFETIYSTDGDDGSSDYRYSLQYDSNTGLWSKIIDHYTLEGGSNTPSGWGRTSRRLYADTRVGNVPHRGRSPAHDRLCPRLVVLRHRVELTRTARLCDTRPDADRREHLQRIPQGTIRRRADMVQHETPRA